MAIRTCIAIHNADNKTITVRTRRGQPGVAFPFENGGPDADGVQETASMKAARKFFASRGVEVEPLDQVHDHKLERRGEYAVRVRFFINA